MTNKCFDLIGQVEAQIKTISPQINVKDSLFFDFHKTSHLSQHSDLLSFLYSRHKMMPNKCGVNISLQVTTVLCISD